MPLTATVVDPGHHHFANDIIYFYLKRGDRVDAILPDTLLQLVRKVSQSGH